MRPKSEEIVEVGAVVATPVALPEGNFQLQRGYLWGLSDVQRVGGFWVCAVQRFSPATQVYEVYERKTDTRNTRCDVCMYFLAGFAGNASEYQSSLPPTMVSASAGAGVTGA